MSGEGGRLVVVATPIGNLDDLPPRAARHLRGCDLVLAEDTRRTGRLLAHIGSEAPQLSLHEHNEGDRLPAVLERLRAGAEVALVCDAGTPGISDPGHRLVRACAGEGIPVEAVPGASAVLAALVVSGLPTDRFAFEGFLPRRGEARRQRLEELAREPRTVVLFASPHRLERDLADLSEVLGADRPAALCRELTKLHEETRRAALGDLHREVADAGVRGEVTLVVGGAPPRPTVDTSPHALVEAVRLRVEAGVVKKEAIKEVAREARVPKRLVYQAVVDAGEP